MVRKHNVLTAIGFTVAIGTWGLIGGAMHAHQVKQRRYHERVVQEAVRFKACPDKLRLKEPPGNCDSYETRTRTRDEADRLAKKGEYVKAGLLYVELGDWVNARNMAGRADSGGREKLKFEIQLKQDAIKEARREAGIVVK
ncbi:MAG: hypothetical protein AB1295_05145 [Candidatus Micrarchaeota archaeon]